MHFKSIEIENFKGIKKLKIDGFNRINFLLGDNQAGKTSVLESLFILCTPSDPERLINIINLRNILIDSINDFNYLFFDRNFEHKITLKSDRTNFTDNLLISKKNVTNPIPLAINNSTLYINTESIIEYHYKYHNHGNLPSDPKNIQLIIQNNVNENSNIKQFIPTMNTTNFLYNGDRNINRRACELRRIENLVDLILYNKIVQIQQNIEDLNLLIEYLNKIGFEIKDIRLGDKNLIFINFKNLPSLIPLNNAGDGLVKIISLVASMFVYKNGVFLIDEIENGLHFSKIKETLNIIIKAAIDFNIQLFITSHNIEILENLILEQQYKEFITAFRMSKNQEHNFAFKMDFDEIETSISSKIEIRR